MPSKIIKIKHQEDQDVALNAGDGITKTNCRTVKPQRRTCRCNIESVVFGTRGRGVSVLCAWLLKECGPEPIEDQIIFPAEASIIEIGGLLHKNNHHECVSRFGRHPMHCRLPGTRESRFDPGCSIERHAKKPLEQPRLSKAQLRCSTLWGTHPTHDDSGLRRVTSAARSRSDLECGIANQTIIIHAQSRFEGQWR